MFLQARGRTLNGELGAIFKRWYPDMDLEVEEMPLAAEFPASPCSPLYPITGQAFASSILPFPHIYRLALRLAFPHRRRTGLPCSGLSHTRMGEARSIHRERVVPMTRKGRVLVPAPVPFWLKPASTFGLLSLTMFLRAFTWVRPYHHPSSCSLRLGADRIIVPSRFRRQSADCRSIARGRCRRGSLPRTSPSDTADGTAGCVMASRQAQQ